MRLNALTALDLWDVDRSPQPYDAEPITQVYERGSIPVIDIHVHINDYHSDLDDVLQATRDYLRIMDQSGIALAVNLSGSPETIDRRQELFAAADNRILLCPGTFFHNGVTDFWWSAADLESFVGDPCLAGLKIWCKYDRPLLRAHIQEKLKVQERCRIPAVGMHISDPPTGRFWHPDYWACISDAEKVIRALPQVQFIMAHGFWLMGDDLGLSVLATLFDAYPNLHVDLSAVYQWWDGPGPCYDNLRDFFIRYKERILFGTDGNPRYTTAERYQKVFTLLESDEKNLQAFFGENKETQLWGLNLPDDVLNYIYYGNAMRLVPQIKAQMEQQSLLSPV